MWTPTDITALPTPIDLIHAKVAIRATEEDLNEAQRRVGDLENDLARRRAWIAPVRRLTHDVLSLIFEFCGEDYWETPLSISEVSRQWRSIVLETPRAWAFLDLERINYDTSGIDLFFQRSGQRPLHISLPGFIPTSRLRSVEKQLKCLSIEGMDGFSKDTVFPLLDRLTIRLFAQLDISYFNNVRFPSLQHLLCNTYITGIPVDSPQRIPWVGLPLQTLSLLIDSDMNWASLLNACKRTIISLKLGIDSSSPKERLSMTLDALKCLEINYCTDDPEPWRLDPKTPALQCYLESTGRRPRYSPNHGDVATVRKMRSDCSPNLASLPLLELLQLYEKSHVSAVLSQLVSNRTLCLNLQRVELLFDPREQNLDLDMDLEEANRHRNIPIELIVSSRLADLPYAITDYACGVSMPCCYWS